jgi:hypothetical protein
MDVMKTSGEIERRAAKLEPVFCAMISTFGIENIDLIDFTKCGVSRQWIEDWWQQHQRKDEISKRIREANATHVLHRMIEREEDIEATVAALEAMVPAGSETYAPQVRSRSQAGG